MQIVCIVKGEVRKIHFSGDFLEGFALPLFVYPLFKRAQFQNHYTHELINFESYRELQLQLAGDFRIFIRITATISLFSCRIQSQERIPFWNSQKFPALRVTWFNGFWIKQVMISKRKVVCTCWLVSTEKKLIAKTMWSEKEGGEENLTKTVYWNTISLGTLAIGDFAHLQVLTKSTTINPNIFAKAEITKLWFWFFFENVKFAEIQSE